VKVCTEKLRNSFFKFVRAQLLAAKSVDVQNQPQPASGRIPFKEKVEKELERLHSESLHHECISIKICRFLKLRGTVPVFENPNIWWRFHHADFPLLARFWIAHSSFPATSASSERVFNMDGLILVPRR
jgi:hypothetical protein